MARQTQQERKAMTREKLRSAAGAAFAHQGFGAVSIDRLAAAAGYSRGAFYAHYTSKQELALELLAEIQEREISAWRSLAIEVDRPEVLLATLERRFDEFAMQDEWWLLQGELQLHAHRDPVFGAKFRKHDEVVTGLLAEMLSAVATRISGRVSFDLKLAVRGLRCMALGIMFDGADKTGTGKIVVQFIRALTTSNFNTNSKGK